MNEPAPLAVLDDRPPAAARCWTYFGLTVVTFALAAALRQLLDHNEADVLVGALHARDPSFIPGDWYLGLDIPYRAVFNLVAGSLAHAIGLVPAAVVGRLVGILCLAAALAPLLARLRVHPALVVPLLVVYQRYRSVVAEEWIVGSFETKTFAYAAALGALGLVLRRRFVLAALLSGLAVDFHVLVGTYAAGTLVATLLWSRRDARPTDADAPRASRPSARWLVPLAVGLVAALPGIVAIGRMFAAGADVDRRMAGEIYVLLRVPHHTYPPHWDTPGSFLRGGLALAVLLVGVRAGRTSATRVVARYALASSMFAIVGLLVLAAGRVDLLKVYWFRFPDAIWPLGAALVAGALVSERVRWPRGRGREVAAVALSCLAWWTLLPAFRRDAAGLASTTRADPVYLRTMPAGVRTALLWVRDHTPPDATVLVDPFLSRTHLASERAQVVSFKCVPQTDREILAWAARLASLAGVRDLREDGGAALARLAAQADRLPAETVARAARDFGAGWYVAAADHALPYPVAAEGRGFRVYRLGDGPTGR